MEGKPDWLGIMPQCCDSAGRLAHVTLQSNENYRTSRQTSSLTNQGSRPIISLWYQEHGDRQRHKFSDKRETAKFHRNYKMSSKMEGKPDWLGIIPQCCDSAHRWALVKLQSNENYRPSRQTSSLTNEASRPKIPLWYQEHGTGKRTGKLNQNRQTFIEITNWAQKWNENQTDWESCHKVAIQQADERMSNCSQTKITGHHVKDYVDQPRISN